MKLIESLGKAPPSRIANKAETAEWFDVSLATLDAWIRRGMPVVVRGHKGQQWEIDLLAVAIWRYGPSEQSEQADVDPDALSPKDRLAWYQGNREKRRDMIDAGELYERAPTLHTFATTIAVFAEQVRAIPDLLERRAGLTPKQAELAADEIDTQLETVKKRLLDQIGQAPSEDAA